MERQIYTNLARKLLCIFSEVPRPAMTTPTSTTPGISQSNEDAGSKDIGEHQKL